MAALLLELKHAARSILRRPGFSATAALILGLGLGLTTYMFGAINAYFLAPLPFPEPDSIVHLETARPSAGERSLEVTLHDFLDWREAQRSLTGLAAFYVGTVNLSGDERAERYDGAFVTANAFDVLGVRPHLGRAFAAGDDEPGAQPVVLLGFDLWQNRYGADAAIVGRSIRVNGRPSTVVGVMPRGLRFPFNEDVWVPLGLDVSRIRRGEGPTLEAFGRLGSGVSLGQARQEFKAIAARLAEQFPDTNKDLTAVVKPFKDEYVGDARETIYTMFGAVCLVLLIACANVANLVLARNAVRRRELAIRTALGASRVRLALHVLAECLVISLAGGWAGYALASWGGERTMQVLRTSDFMAPPYWVRFESDWRTWLFALTAAFVAAAAAGLAPALRASRTDVVPTLRQGGLGVSPSTFGRLTRVLLSAQVAFAFAVLVCAGLMARSVASVQNVPIGGDIDNVLTGRVGLFENAYPERADRTRFFERLLELAAALPGASAVTVATGLPGGVAPADYYAPEGIELGSSASRPVARQVTVGPGYFEAFRIPLHEGSGFDRQDRQDGAPIAIVSRSLVQRHWPGQSALGKRIQLGRAAEGQPWRTVVGVVGDVFYGRLDDQPLPAVYLPLAQVGPRFMSLAVKTGGEPLRLAEPLRKAVRELDPDVPVYWLRTLEDVVDMGRFAPRFLGTLFAIFAVVGIALGSAGQYAVLAYAVSQRTREIGVRRALGARDGEILRMTLGDGLRHLGIGLGVGLMLSLVFARLLSSELVGVAAFDPLTFAAVLLGLSLAVLLASLLPARRALEVDPAVALRCE
jgi:predicted permease